MSTEIQVQDEPLWFIAYDVESENSKSLKENEKDWLRDMRVSIWYMLRYKYKCVPIQHSLWLIRDPKTRDALQELKEQWLKEYAKGNYHALIEIFPIQSNEAGYKTFKAWEFEFILEWLGKIEKSLVKSRDTGKITKKNIQAHTKKIELLMGILREDFDSSFPNWRIAQDQLSNVQDLLHIVSSGTDIIT